MRRVVSVWWRCVASPAMLCGQVAATAGCGGQVEPRGTSEDVPSAPLGDARASCGSAIHGPLDSQANADVAGHLVGKWLTCTGSHFFADKDGVEFREDGTWSALQVQGRDLVAVPGIETGSVASTRGSWTYADGGDKRYVRIGLGDGGNGPVEVLTTFVFETSPVRMKAMEGALPEVSVPTSWLVPYVPGAAPAGP